jgi:hypothetical protein
VCQETRHRPTASDRATCYAPLLDGGSEQARTEPQHSRRRRSFKAAGRYENEAKTSFGLHDSSRRRGPRQNFTEATRSGRAERGTDRTGVVVFGLAYEARCFRLPRCCRRALPRPLTQRLLARYDGTNSTQNFTGHNALLSRAGHDCQTLRRCHTASARTRS